MSIRIAEHAGFCFGVKRATGELENELLKYGGKRRICTLGRIIHNDHYVDYIKSLGVEEISRDDIPGIIAAADRGDEITVVIRAHGELKTVVDELLSCAERNAGFKLLDCTCPYVRKVRKIAEENSGEDKLFLLLGSENHPEVEGIMSCTRGKGVVLADSKEVEAWIEANKNEISCETCISFAAQTTQNLAEWQKSIKFIKKVYTNALIFDTICNVTQLRQEEAAKLAKESDVMIVIGSQDSSNSRKLRDISGEYCREVYFISHPSECPELKSENINMSITAGASTPYSLIQEVYKTMIEQNENFAELLESSFKTLNTGEIVEGVITSISQNEIHLGWWCWTPAQRTILQSFCGRRGRR